jgi:hypothetical protein
MIIKGSAPKELLKDKKYHIGSGSIVDEDGTVYATCEGKFFPMPEVTDTYVLDKLHILGEANQKVNPKDIWGSS